MLRDIKSKVDITDHQTSDQLRNQEISQLEDHHALPFYRQRAMISCIVNSKFYKKNIILTICYFSRQLDYQYSLQVSHSWLELFTISITTRYESFVSNNNARVSGINYWIVLRILLPQFHDHEWATFNNVRLSISINNKIWLQFSFNFGLTRCLQF